ncbi:MAG: hypothetical protein KKA05_07135 [Alphaproteobacteria bacterium]|nr:hypothetical protein [Alphaproteobacteria bacterium]
MTTYLPRDAHGNPIPAVRLKSSGAHTVAVSNSTARNSTAFNADTRIISLYATVPVFIKFGDESVTATASDHYYPSGLYYDFAIGGDETAHLTHVAVLRVGDTDGSLYVSEKE